MLMRLVQCFLYENNSEQGQVYQELACYLGFKLLELLLCSTTELAMSLGIGIPIGLRLLIVQLDVEINIIK